MSRYKTYSINTKRAFKDGGRQAPAISEKEFLDKLAVFVEQYKEDYDDTSGAVWGTALKIIRRMYTDKKSENWIKKDFKGIKFDWENYDIVGDVRTTKGIPYQLFNAHGDWEIPVYFMIYYDGKKIRVYVPTVGNTWRQDLKQALGNVYKAQRDIKSDDEYVYEELLKDKLIDKQDNVPGGIAEHIVADKDLMIKDFSNRLEVKKKSTNEKFDSETERLRRAILEDVCKYFQKKINESLD
jgi:hypothetical protein